MERKKMETVVGFIFLRSKITADGDYSHKIKRCLLLGRKAMTNLERVLKSRDTILLPKFCIVKAMFFPVVMYGYESWTINNVECWRIDGLELLCWSTLESPLDWKIKPVNSKGNQPWIFIGRTDAEAEVAIPWPSNVKNWLTEKDPGAGKDWEHEEKAVTED